MRVGQSYMLTEQNVKVRITEGEGIGSNSNPKVALLSFSIGVNNLL